MLWKLNHYGCDGKNIIELSNWCVGTYTHVQWVSCFMLGRFGVTCRTSKKTESIIYIIYHVHNLYRQELQKIQKGHKYGEFKSFKVTLLCKSL